MGLVSPPSITPAATSASRHPSQIVETVSSLVGLVSPPSRTSTATLTSLRSSQLVETTASLIESIFTPSNTSVETASLLIKIRNRLGSSRKAVTSDTKRAWVTFKKELDSSRVMHGNEVVTLNGTWIIVCSCFATSALIKFTWHNFMHVARSNREIVAILTNNIQPPSGGRGLVQHRI